jgi:hypothetical protein
MFSIIPTAATEEADETEPGSETREKSVAADWAAVDGSVILDEADLRSAKAESLIAGSAALSAFDEYNDRRDATTLEANRCWPCLSPARDAIVPFPLTKDERSSTETSETVNWGKQTRDTAPCTSTASNAKDRTPLATEIPEK